VAAGGNFGGTGTVGGITNYSGGIVSPGDFGPGLLTCGDAYLQSGSTFRFYLDGPRSGIDYSALIALGTATLTGAVLNVDQELQVPLGVGSVLYPIQADSVVGTFNGLPDGSAFNLGGIGYQINYTANYVQMTVTSVPGISSGYSVSGGTGNHTISPNGCNDLYLSVSNDFESPLDNVTAILSSDTPHVVVTQPDSDYPNISAGGGNATNLTAFQITTLPTFPCGSNINLTLSIYSSLSDFNIPIVLPTGSPGTPGTPVEFDNSSLATIPMNPGW